MHMNTTTNLRATEPNLKTLLKTRIWLFYPANVIITAEMSRMYMWKKRRIKSELTHRENNHHHQGYRASIILYYQYKSLYGLSTSRLRE